MKEIFRIESPIGKYVIQYGEFMKNDGLKHKFHCWRNGGRLGGKSNNFEESKKYLEEMLKEDLNNELNKSIDQIVDIRSFIKEYYGEKNE